MADELTDEHELVRKTRNAFDLENLNRRGMAWPRDNGTLDVVVAPENIDRALRIGHAIAEGLEERGGELSAKPGEESVAKPQL